MFQQLKEIKGDLGKDNLQKEIFTLLQEMQDCGSPPEDLLQSLGMASPSEVTRESNPADCIQQ